MTFTFQISNGLSITNSPMNLKTSIDFEDFCINHKEDNFKFIVEESLVDSFKEIGLTISNSWKADIVLIDKENYLTIEKTEEKKHILLIVNNGEDLYSMFSSVIENAYKIDIKIDVYEKEKFKVQVDEISNLLKDKNVLVPLLNGFLLEKEKFEPFGETELFVAGDSIYYHPDFYYNGFEFGKVSSMKEFDAVDKELVFHFSRPHLLCLACNCFYCDRNIYKNRVRTGEYKTPSTYSCATNTVFTNASKKLFNNMMDTEIFKEEDLDVIKTSKDKIDADGLYEKIKNNTVMTNKIKKMDFKDRLFE